MADMSLGSDRSGRIVRSPVAEDTLDLRLENFARTLWTSMSENQQQIAVVRVVCVNVCVCFCDHRFTVTALHCSTTVAARQTNAGQLFDIDETQ